VRFYVFQLLTYRLQFFPDPVLDYPVHDCRYTFKALRAFASSKKPATPGPFQTLPVRFSSHA
jgi:hypothetical protein